MMDNKEIFSKAFSCLTPLSDNETIYNNVTERAKKMNSKKKISMKKPLSVLLAAALTIAAATVSVGAATGWNFNGAFDSIFRQRTEAFEAAPDYREYKSGFDFQKYGKELDLHYSFKNYALNIKGVIADNSTAYVVYDVIFDKAYDYGEKDKYTPWDMIAILETADKAMNTGSDGIISVDNNRFTFYKMATSSDESKTLVGNTLVLQFYRLTRGIENSVDCEEYYSEEQTLDCGITVEIPVDFPVYSPKVYSFIEENSKEYLLDYINGEEYRVDAKLETVSISPLSCDFSFMTEAPEGGFSKGECYMLDDFSFTDKNGNEIIISNTSYSIDVEDNGRMSYHVPLNQPIEPDEIESVTVGGTTVIIN